MGSLQIEGDLEGLSEKQIKFICDVFDKRGFSNNKVIFKPAGKAGDNYIANVKRISVIGEDGKDFKVIAKIAPEKEALRTMMNTAFMFKNETVMYDKVLPKLVSLQRAAGVPEEELFRYAECYGCLTEEPSEVILLEDLNESNFVMLDRLKPLSSEAIKLVLKNFAVLHSLSYVIKKKEPETYDNFRTELTDMWELNCSADEFVAHFVQIEQSAIAVVDDEKYKNALYGVVSQFPTFIKEVKKVERFSKHLIIQQGDGWSNNILFKLEGEKTKDCVMIDYQLSKEANPACDILYMVFNCSDHVARTEHYQEWLEYYHDELDKSLSYFGMNAKDVYPKEGLDADLKKYSNIYLCLSVVLYCFLSRKPEESKKLQDAMKELDMQNLDLEQITGVGTLSSDTVAIFKSRIEDLIDSYHLLGYIS